MVYQIILMDDGVYKKTIKTYKYKKHAFNFLEKINKNKIFCEKKYEFRNKKLIKTNKKIFLIKNDGNSSELIKKIKYKEEEVFKNNVYKNRIDFITIINNFFNTKKLLEVIIINNKIIIYGNKIPYIITCKNTETTYILYNKLKIYFKNKVNILFVGTFNKRNNKKIYHFLNNKYGIKKSYLYRKKTR